MYDFIKKNRDNSLALKKRGESGVRRIPSIRPSLQLAEYSGEYYDEMYGDIFINQIDGNQREILFSHTPVFHGILSHWQYDTFKIDWYDVRIPDGWLSFEFNANREIRGISLDH